jgi:hypothetical protein
MSDETTLARIVNDRIEDVKYACYGEDFSVAKAACEALLASVNAFNETQSEICSDILYEALDLIADAFTPEQHREICEMFGL